MFHHSLSPVVAVSSRGRLKPYELYADPIVHRIPCGALLRLGGRGPVLLMMNEFWDRGSKVNINHCSEKPATTLILHASTLPALELSSTFATMASAREGGIVSRKAIHLAGGRAYLGIRRYDHTYDHTASPWSTFSVHTYQFIQCNPISTETTLPMTHHRKQGIKLIGSKTMNGGRGAS